MDEPARDRAHRAWRSAERIRKLSDRVVGLGPFGLGLDGVLSWVPGAGTLYSVGAGGLLLYEAVQAGASKATIARMAAYLALDSASSGVWGIGSILDTFFTGHAYAARALQKDVEKRHGKPEMGDTWSFGRSANAPPEPQRMRDVTPERR